MSLIDLLKEVIVSWQVIFITVALIIYLALVLYVARLYHRPSSRRSSRLKRPKRVKQAASDQVQVTDDDDDGLGLDEGGD